MKIRTNTQAGSTLVVTISVVAALLVLLGTAVEYTSQISRNTQRSRKTAAAMEIADGHLEALFTSWRNIYRTAFTTYTTSYQGSGGTDYSLLPTNYFYTTCSTCNPLYSGNTGPLPSPIPFMSPSGTPSPIPLPPSSLFPTEPNYTVDQYRIQAVNPMIELDANGNAIDVNGAALSKSAIAPSGNGPNDWQYSYFYLASVDVTVPTLRGNVTAKVRRVFEKKFDNPWTYAMFYVDDLELHPTSAFTLSGPIHTNGNLYIGTSNFSAAPPSWPSNPTSGRIGYGSEYINGYAPNDGQHTATPTAPNFAKSDPSLAISDMPPSQVSPYLPFGWNLSLSTASGSGANNDSYHELIERPSFETDPIAGIRYYTQRPYVVDTQDVLTGNPGTPGASCRILINEHYWKFANAADRIAPGPYTSSDIGKVAYETAGVTHPSVANYGTYWRLTGVTGTSPNATPTWTIIPERTSFAFANTSARTGASYTSNDIGKIAYQYDTDTYWRIGSVAPSASWAAVPMIPPSWGSIAQWTFSSAALRKAAGSYGASDVNRIAYQSDDGSFWRLTGHTVSGSLKYPVWESALQVDKVTVYTWAANGSGTLVATPHVTSGTTSTGVKNADAFYDKVMSALSTSEVLYDNREGGLVRVTSLDVNAFSDMARPATSWLANFSGVLYIADFGGRTLQPSGTVLPGNPISMTLLGSSGNTSESSVVRRAIRLRNGATLLAKLTIVSDNPIYIQGNFNTGVNPPSNSGTYTSPTGTGYTRWASAVIGDAISVLSNNWNDNNSNKSRPQRIATNTTINAALVGGIVPSGSGSGNSYSGGGENFVRFLEDWGSDKTFCYYGSMVQLYKSQQATGTWTGSGNQYSAPLLKWFWDVNFSYDAKGTAPADPHWGSPPGNLQIAAYLQQQRWYQVY